MMLIKAGFLIYFCIGIFLTAWAYKRQKEKSARWTRELPPAYQLLVIIMVALFYPLAFLYVFYKWVTK